MTDNLIEKAEALLGRYQALTEHTKTKPNTHSKEYYREKAAKELGLQVTQ